jgi:hypothetical protein
MSCDQRGLPRYRECWPRVAQPRPCGSIRSVFPKDPAALYYRVACIAIGLVSVHDAHLVKIYQPVILSVERNPVCATLIAWDPTDLSFFLGAKMVGTLLTLAVLLVLFARYRRLALPVVSGVAAFQFALLLYLHIAWY